MVKSNLGEKGKVYVIPPGIIEEGSSLKKVRAGAPAKTMEEYLLLACFYGLLSLICYESK